MMNYKLILVFITLLFSCGVQNERVSKPSSKLTISPGATTLLQVITGRFPGVTVIGDKVLIRGGSLSINNQVIEAQNISDNFSPLE